MSTFNGLVSEFPRIRIDHFRIHPCHPPPMACFLSHVHSDHLQGLESLKAPFVYCSAATRGLLLCLERYPHRINFMKGVIESRQQHYKHLKFVLKAVPLECPTEIELGPLEKIKVTLFDANHCPGAVMFLIEGDSKAVLYTGDIRSEPWWVNSLVRSPVLLPYATGLKQLDRIYLDTTFAVKEDIYRTFPSKAEGVQELLAKARTYPPETLFYLNTWTLGYEDVLVALSSFLNSQVHVDSYQSRLYASLANADGKPNATQYSALGGFYVGNHHKPGCLTTQSRARIHSCESGTPCHTELLKAKQVVWITPIVTRSQEGMVVPEVGAGGGGGDLHQTSVLELYNGSCISEMEDFCKQIAQDPEDLSKLLSKLETARASTDHKMPLDGIVDAEEEITLQEFTERLLAMDKAILNARDGHVPYSPCAAGDRLQDTIQFPFSRHSSYGELCSLVAAFKPVDIYPCTVEEQTWTENVSIGALFGHLCAGTVFFHDEHMRLLMHENLSSEAPARKRHKTIDNDSSPASGSADSTSQGLNIAASLDVTISSQAARTQHSKDAYVILEEEPSRQCQSTAPNVAAIEAAYKFHMGRAAMGDPPSPLPNDDIIDGEQGSPRIRAQAPASQISISPSAFDSQPLESNTDPVLQVDGVQDENVPYSAENDTISASNRLDQRSRRNIRGQAYRAAKLALQTSDSGDWDDLGIRSVGQGGHCEPEEYL